MTKKLKSGWPRISEYSLGNTDEKYLPYAVLKVQKITTFTKDNKDTKESENQLVMTAGSLSV